MQRKLLFFVNPRAGHSEIRGSLMQAIQIFTAGGYEVTVHPTSAPRDLTRQIAERAAGYDLVVCTGGDGTLNEAVSGLMQLPPADRPPLGYIPGGTVNDVAKTLGLSLDPILAAQDIVTGREFPIDIGAFGKDRWFVYVAAFGLFTEVSYKTSQEWKNVLGHAAYILEGAKCLHDIPSFLMQVEYDNVRLQDEFIYGMISNSTSVGGFKGMTGKDVLLDDGVFEVTLIKKPKNPIELNEIIASLINLVDDTDMIYSFKTSEVRFTAKNTIPWTLDGEFGGDHEEVVVKNLCRAVEIMVPQGE